MSSSSVDNTHGCYLMREWVVVAQNCSDQALLLVLSVAGNML